MGISIWQLLIILAIALVIFGGKKLRNLGGDLGGAIKNFKHSMKDEEGKDDDKSASDQTKRVTDESGRVIDAKVTSKETSQEKKKA